MLRLLTFLFLSTALIPNTSSQTSLPNNLTNGAIWPDNRGIHINAHGGGILQWNGKFWWYGEHRPKKGHHSEGVALYSSTDLIHWDYEGIPLKTKEDNPYGVVPGCIIERPKVIYNDSTEKFIMWFHHELKGEGYTAAQAAVAIADNPRGPFSVLKSERPDKNILPENFHLTDSLPSFSSQLDWWSPQWREEVKNGMFTIRDLENGQMSRDMTVFKDSDGKAYHIYSSEENLTLHIAELSPDYTSHSGHYIRIFPGGHNEAPTIFKANGQYWMLTSGCTGWDPNEARLMHSSDIMGEWEQLPNPCKGENSDKTFLAQSTFIISLESSPGTHIAMFDIWDPSDLQNSRYVWLPVKFSEDGTPEIHWNPAFKP